MDPEYHHKTVPSVSDEALSRHWSHKYLLEKTNREQHPIWVNSINK